jgi:hypothetical protein
MKSTAERFKRCIIWMIVCDKMETTGMRMFVACFQALSMPLSEVTE